MTNTKKIVTTIVTVLLIAVMATTLSILFANNSRNVIKNNGISASVANTRAITVDPTRDRFREGDKHVDGLVPKYGEIQWNGKIWVDLHVGGDSFVFVNVDIREKVIYDDVIVEYRSYYKSGSSEINQKLSNFRFTVRFFSGSSQVGYVDENKSNDSQAGFTRPSKSNKVNGAIATVYITTTSGVSRTAHFFFGNQYAGCN